jgi:hypothetical protein
MTKFLARRLNTDWFREIVGAAGLILGAAGAVRLLWPVSHRIGDGAEICGSVISRQPGDVVCSHLLGTAVLAGGLLAVCGAAMFVWACVMSVRSARSPEVRLTNGDAR